MDIKKELGSKIKRLRLKKGLTQAELAEMANISIRTLGGIEIGENFMTVQTLEKIIECLDISADELFNAAHLKPTAQLVDEIHGIIDDIKDDSDKVEEIYKILKAVTTV